VIEDLLKRQDGVITGGQAKAAGMSQDMIERRVRSGAWLRHARGVYFVDDRPYTDEARTRVGVLSYGDRAVASGLSAAWWLGLRTLAPDLVEVTVPRDANQARREGIRVRRRDIPASDVIEVRGLRVTSLPLTTLEAAVQRSGGTKLFDSALQRRVDLSALWAAQLRNKGRHGSPAARRLLHAATDGTRSEAERILARLLRRAGITGWTSNHPIAGYKVDFVFQGPDVVLEADGLAFHSGADDFHHDRIRQNAITLAGYTVLRFTWIELTEHPERVIAVIRRALAQRSAC
jgi:very-short-patch-repair endonuclease